MVVLSGGHARLQVVGNTDRVDTTIFADGFESGDVSAWSSATP